jgi:hypothetical protein
VLGAVVLAVHSRGLAADPIRGSKGLEGFVLRTGLGGAATPERLVAQLGPRQGVYVEAAEAPEPAVIVPTYDLEQRATMLERSKRLGGG